MEINKLHTCFLECNSISTDTRKINKGDMFFALKGENFNGNKYIEEALLKGAKYVIIDEVFFPDLKGAILVNNVLETVQALATYHRNYLKVPIIALTGSNGKTTTKELINAVLSKKYKTTATTGNLNNHIGVPLTLLSMNQQTEIGIVEMGANHQKEIELLCNIAKPDYGLITNFGKAHLEGFGGVEGVIKGKSEMYTHLIQNNKMVFVNYNDAIQIEKTKEAKIFTFGTEHQPVDVKINYKDAKPFVSCEYEHSEIRSQLIGDYNFNNMAIAITIGNYFKVKKTDIKYAIENFVPSNNRSQIIKKGRNNIILDAYNANPTSMKAALENFEKQKDTYKIAILGDMFELGEDAEKEHQFIADLASTMSFNHVVLIGENFYKTKLVSPKITVFKSFLEFQGNINFSQFTNATLLIKGSRGMALERTLDLI